MRTGVLGRKVGMTSVITTDGNYIPATILDVNNCQVVNVKTIAKDGYNALQVGFGDIKSKNLSKPLRHYFAKLKISIKRKLLEFRVDSEALLKIGDIIAAEHFVCGQKVDVAAQSIGKGFAGVMKRHNFKGLCASHGTSISHRSHGSTGQCQDPGKVFKGKKMAGHLGNKRVTMQNLEVIEIDNIKGLVIVKGSVPGFKGCFVQIKDAVKTVSKVDLPFPGALVKEKIQSSVQNVDDKLIDIVANDENTSKIQDSQSAVDAQVDDVKNIQEVSDLSADKTVVTATDSTDDSSKNKESVEKSSDNI